MKLLVVLFFIARAAVVTEGEENITTLLDSIFSDSSPDDAAGKSASSASDACECVPYYLCTTELKTENVELLDKREPSYDTCKDFLQICCKKEQIASSSQGIIEV